MTDLTQRLSQMSPTKLALLAQELRAKARLAAMEPIAVIGLGCRFPGDCDTPAAFWQLLRQGTDAITEPPPDRWDVDTYYHPDPQTPGKMVTRYGGFIQHPADFDAHFFNIPPKEAISLDPQQRLLLEVSWEALENAGLIPAELMGSQTGVFVGLSTNDYFQRLVTRKATDIDAYLGTGYAHSVAAGRLSYLLGLHGPSMAVDTACSSSLVAVHLACQSLRNGESDLALAGGVNVILTPENSITLSKSQMLAPDGRCKTFDAAANGYVRAEGCGIVVLKRLSDAMADGDTILALIRGTAVNQDGRTSGLTVPNGPAQQAVIQQALDNGGVDPNQISYVEAHGTGTLLGDPIELGALGAVFADNPTPLIVGSVKTNVGHLEAAAGAAGLIKVILALQHQQIPPHLHFKQPNPHIPWADLSIKIPTQLMSWPAGQSRRLAGVSSFSFSGANAHIVVEETPADCRSAIYDLRLDVDRPDHPKSHLLTLSAKTEQALLALAERYQQHLAENPDLSVQNICYTTQTGRSHFDYRLGMVVESRQDIRDKLTACSTGQEASGLFKGYAPDYRRSKAAFVFAGQVIPDVNMGRQLYQTQPVFRTALKHCAEIVEAYLGEPLLSTLYPKMEGQKNYSVLNRKSKIVTLFALEYALAQLWQSWGVEPALVMGYDVGEYVAACVAGVFSLDDGLRLVVERGRLRQLLAFADDTQSPSVESTPVNFEQTARDVTYTAPKIPFILSLTGQTATAEEVMAPAYWVRHLRGQAQILQGVETAFRQGITIFMEIGPAPILSDLERHYLQTEKLAKLSTDDDPQRQSPPEIDWLPGLPQGKDEEQQLLQTLARLYVCGGPVDWVGLTPDDPQPRHKVSLPTYPFQRQRYWVETSRDTDSSHPHHRAAPEEGTSLATASAIRQQLENVPAHGRYDFLVTYLQAMITDLLGADIPPKKPFDTLPIDSMLLAEIMTRIVIDLGLEVSAKQIIESSSIATLAKQLAEQL